MSMDRRRDGLFWSSLFSIPAAEQKQLLEQMRSHQGEYDGNVFCSNMLSISRINSIDYMQEKRKYMTAACEHVALKFMLFDTDLASFLLDDEELEKARELYAVRKQYGSKLLKSLLGSFSELLKFLDYRKFRSDCFTISLLDEFRKVEEKEVSNSFGILKKTVEAISSGVHNQCYIDAEQGNSVGRTSLYDELNELVKEKISYVLCRPDYSKESSTLFYPDKEKKSNAVLQLALVNDKGFWEKHERFDVIRFLNAVFDRNGIRHAKKVLYSILDNLLKSPNAKLAIENGLPLYASDYELLVEKLEEQAELFAFKRLKGYCDVSKINGFRLCYPMSKAEPEFFEIGKAVWESFITEYNYPNDHERVSQYLCDEVKAFTDGQRNRYDDIAVIFDIAPFRCSANNEDRQIFGTYHPDCFSYENIWNRVYLKAYAVTLLSDDRKVQHSFLQRIFVDIIKVIERNLGIPTVHQLDTLERDKHYGLLKEMLAKHGIEISDEHKTNYILSLLDRDTALLDEIDHFPVLEQMGDAIYGMAVAELLFYNPKNIFDPDDNYDPEGENIQKRFENFTRAEAQVFVAKKNGLHELFIHTGLPAKYIEYDTLFFKVETLNDESLQELKQEKYLADALEMVIGAICFDKGIHTALEFSKKLLRERFPKDFAKEIRRDDRDNCDEEEIDWEFWPRILPGLYSDMSAAHRTLWRALNKLTLALSLGTDTEAKRRYITNNYGNLSSYGEWDNHGISWPFYYYLHFGLDYVLQKYGNVINEHFTEDYLKFFKK